MPSRRRTSDAKPRAVYHLSNVPCALSRSKNNQVPLLWRSLSLPHEDPYFSNATLGRQVSLHRKACRVYPGCTRRTRPAPLLRRSRCRKKTGAGNILDDEWLAKLVGELFADDARDDVGAAAWSGGDDVGNRPRRIVLREGRRRETIAAASAL